MENNTFLEPKFATFEQAKYFFEKGCPILAPQQWQVVVWLRVKHGIWIGVWSSSGLFWWEISKGEKMLSPLGKHEYSPQQAYSAAFDYIKEKRLI